MDVDCIGFHNLVSPSTLNEMYRMVYIPYTENKYTFLVLHRIVNRHKKISLLLRIIRDGPGKRV